MVESEDAPSDRDALEAFAAFEAAAPEELRNKSWTARLKSFMKQHLPKGDDGRLHGTSRQSGKMIDAAVNFMAVSQKCSSTNETWTDDVLDGGGIQNRQLWDQTFPFTLEKLAPLAETSICGRVLYMSRYMSELGQVQLLNGEYVAAVHSLASAYRFSELPVQWIGHLHAKALKHCNDLVSADQASPRTRADALFVRCHLRTLRRDLAGALNDLRVAQRLLPKDSALYECEGDLCNCLNNRHEALVALDTAKRLGSQNITSIYFTRGCILQNCVQDAGALLQARQSLETFIRLADADERKLCEAYYHLAMIRIQDGKLGEARRQYDKGVEAESRRLSCFQEPKSNYRKSAEALLLSIHPCGLQECSSPGTLLCSCKVVRYCGTVCQKKDWKSHKGVCKIQRSAGQTGISSAGPASSAPVSQQERANEAAKESAVHVKAEMCVQAHCRGGRLASQQEGQTVQNCKPFFVHELRDTLDSIGQNVVREDDVLGPLVRTMHLLGEKTLQTKIADSFIVKALAAFCDAVESDPSQRHFVIDLACPRDPINSLRPAKGALMATFASEILMNHVLVSLPLWNHRRALRRGAVSNGISWFMEAHTVMEIPGEYDEHDWQKTDKTHGTIDATSVKNSLSGVLGFWGDDVSIVGKLGADVARNKQDSIVLRVLRSTGNVSYARSIRELALQQTPANCFTLWIREDVPSTLPCFRPLNASMPLVSQLLDYGKDTSVFGMMVGGSGADSGDEDDGGKVPDLLSAGS